ncbi:MAG: class II fructose-bisphosphate aldolase [Actinomycetota bacterium]|nr:class II fructose-bisphosphate aldolase [Actinomycetota bacterium]
MPIATPDQYNAMLDAAREGKYAYPAINITSSETLNAAMRGFADAGADGIIEVSHGGGSFASGTYVNSMSLGAQAIAEMAYLLAEEYPVLIALHTDHCQADKVDAFIRPLLEVSRERRSHGLPPLYQSHMFDGSAIDLDSNLEISAQLLEEMRALDIILELEVGVVGGEEDGVSAEGTPREKLYTTNEDLLKTVEAIGLGEKGRYMLAATFGNVHGLYKPGNVQLRPEVLRDGQEAIKAEHGEDAWFDYVFHGGSGSELQDIHDAIEYGVIKMNIDTDNQYTFTRSIADHMFTNYEGVLMIDGEIGNKKVYDPRSYLKKAEIAMAEGVTEACVALRAEGRSLLN